MWARRVPYAEFGRLRAEAPVAWFPDQGSGFWSVHRYADIVAASRDVAGIDGVMVSEHIVLGPSADAAGRPENPRDYALPGDQDPASPWPSPVVLLRQSGCP